MSLKKDLLLLVVSYLTTRNTAPTPNQLDLVDVLKRQIRLEASRLAIRVLIGLAVVSLMSWAMIQVGKSVQVILARNPQGPALEIAAFGGLIALCSAGLYALFKQRTPKPIAHTESTAAPLPLSSGLQDMERLLAHFMEGFSEGMHRHTPAETVDSPTPSKPDSER